MKKTDDKNNCQKFIKIKNIQNIQSVIYIKRDKTRDKKKKYLYNLQKF